MICYPWLQKDWEKSDPRLAELAACPVRLPHLDDVIKKIPLQEGIFSILGPRQVGKSTLLRLLVKKILVLLPPSAVALVEGDAIETWRELLSLLTDCLQKLPSQSLRGAILIDEITSIPEWYRALKLLADRGQLKRIFLLYTGSSVTSLKEGGEFLPGRRGRHRETSFEVFPVAYGQIADHLSLEEYFKIGGFPWAINEYLRLHTLPPYVGEIYWGWLKGEFLKRGKSDILLKHVVTNLSQRLCTPFSNNKLAQESGIVSHETARQYLELLQNCFAIKELMWIDPIKKKIAPRKNRKYYPLDPLLYHLFRGSGAYDWTPLPLSPEEQGRIAELVVCQELNRKLKTQNLDLGYWMGKREIDFMPVPVEVKYQNRVIPDEFAWFKKSFPKLTLLILTKNDTFYRDGLKAMPLVDWLLASDPSLP